MLKIVNAPSTVLSEPAKKVTKIDKPILNLIGEMKKTLLLARDPEGVGLAAPQVGKSLQIFVVKESEKSPFRTFINPAIIEQQPKANLSIGIGSVVPRKVQRSSAAKGTKLEGCLSLPTIWGIVKRNPQIEVSYQDEKGNHYQKVFKGFLATIIQHEMDHLNGVLFPKRVLEQKGKLFKSHKNEKGEDEFEEIEI